MVAQPDPLIFGAGPTPNKGLYYDAAGKPMLEDYIGEQDWTITVTAAIAGDLSVVITNPTCRYSKRGRNVDIAGNPTFAPTYTSTAWAANTAVTVGLRRTNGGNVYEVTTAGTTAASGGPTGTGTGITDGTAVWKYVSATTSGSIVIGGLPILTSLTWPRSFINCVPANALTFPNNGTSLYYSPLQNDNRMNIVSAKSGAGSSTLAIGATTFASGGSYNLPFDGRYKAAA